LVIKNDLAVTPCALVRVEGTDTQLHMMQEEVVAQVRKAVIFFTLKLMSPDGKYADPWKSLDYIYLLICFL
jgi:hypothetical protein